MRKLLLLLLLISFAFAQCSGNYTLELPAYLSNGKGTLIPVSVELSEGGDLLLSLNIDVGESTMKSIRDAYSYALSRSGRKCSLTIHFPEELERVDGPSGGAYLAISFLYLLTNPSMLSLLRNVSITGAVDEDGNVYPVGGLYEKAKASLSEGKGIFIAPITSRLESFLLDQLPIEYYHISHVGEITPILEGKMAPGAPHLFQEFLPERNLSTDSISFFQPLYEGIKERYLSLLSSLSLDEPYATYYRKVGEKAEEVAERGYYYTAANELFLKLSELYAISSYSEGKEVEDVAEEVAECLSSYEFPNYTEEGYEWAGGSILRYYRAKATYDAVVGDNSPSTYYTMEQMARLSDAHQWCLLAKELAQHATGSPIPQDPLKEEADELLQRLKGQEVEGIIPYALKEYSEGHYLTVLYLLRPMLWEDSAYYKNDSLWYAVYHSQAEYLQDEDLERYARVYGSIAKDVEDALQGQTAQSTSPADEGVACWNIPQREGILSLAFLFFLLFYIAWYHGGGGTARSP